MKTRTWLSTGTFAALAMAAVGALAQETPPKTDPQTQEPEPEEKPVPDRWNEVTIGYNSFRENSALSYYARPTEGLSLHYLRLLHPGSPEFPYAKLTIRGLPNQDNVVTASVALNRGHTIVSGRRAQHSFYNLDWRPKDRSEDNESRYTLDHSFTPDFGGFLLYVANERDGRYPAPRDPEHTSTRFVAGGLGGKVGGGNLGVTVSDRRTFDDTGARPETLQRQVNATYSRDFGSDFSLAGSAGYSRIEQAGLDSSGIHTYTLSGAWDLGPATGMQFLFGQQNMDLNTVLNAYARKRLVSSARLVHRWPGWSLQFGYRHRETERVRADHSFVDVPKVNEYDARLAGKLGPARLTLRGSWEDLRASAVMNTQDSRSLLWDDRATFQAKLDGGSDLFTAYGTYTYRFQQNNERGVDIGWHNIAVGGSYIFTPVLNGYAEFAADDFRVGGDAESGQSLDFYFPSSRSVAMGLNWSKDPTLTASASLNYYESGDVRGTQLTFSVRRRLGPDHDLELTVAPWLRDDKLNDLTGYRATFLMARYTVRF